MTSPTELRVYLAIRAQPQTPKAVSELLGLPYGGVCTAVSRLRDCGYLAPVERRGKYTIYSVTDRVLDIAEAEARARRAPRQTAREDGYGSGGRIALEEVWR